MDTLSLGGSESAGLYMSRELVRRGHQVTAFTNGQPGKWDGVEIASIGQSNEQFPAGMEYERRAAAELREAAGRLEEKLAGLSSAPSAGPGLAKGRVPRGRRFS